MVNESVKEGGSVASENYIINIQEEVSNGGIGSVDELGGICCRGNEAKL